MLRLIAFLGLNKTGFDAGIDAANKKVAAFGSGLKGQLAGAFTAAAVVSYAKNLLTVAESVGDMSERLGLAVADTHALSLAAKLGGTDIEFMARKIEKLRNFIGTGGNLSAFGIEDASDTIAVMSKISDIITTTGLSAVQANKLVEIFGKGSGQMITVLSDLKTAQEAVKFDEQDARYAQKFSDQMVLAVNAINVGIGKYISYSLRGRELLLGMVGLGGQGVAKARVSKNDLSEIAAAEQAAADREEFSKGWIAMQERIISLERETVDITEKSRRAKLTDAARLLEIKKEESELQKKIDLEVPVTTWGAFREEYYAMQKRLAELGAERGQIDGKTKIASAAVQSDQFQRIGAFTGSAGVSAQTMKMNAALSALEQIKLALTSRGIIVRGTD